VLTGLKFFYNQFAEITPIGLEIPITKIKCSDLWLLLN